MKKGTTTPLPPSPTGSRKGEYIDIIDIIDNIWQDIDKVEKQLKETPSLGLMRQLEYYYNLSDYWEGVYLCLMGIRFYEQFL